MNKIEKAIEFIKIDIKDCKREIDILEAKLIYMNDVLTDLVSIESNPNFPHEERN